MLKIAALIAFLFCQLLAEACPATAKATGAPGASAESDTPPESNARIEAAAEPELAIAPVERSVSRAATGGPMTSAPATAGVADAAVLRPVVVVCGPMTRIQRFERRIRHDQVRFRGRKEVS